MFWYFGGETCGIIVPQPGIEPVPPALEGKVLITRPLGKPLYIFLMYTDQYRETRSLTKLLLWASTFLSEPC